MSFIWSPLVPAGTDLLAGAFLTGVGTLPSLTGVGALRSGYALEGAGVLPSLTGVGDIVRQYFLAGEGTLPSLSGLGQFSSRWVTRTLDVSATWEDVDALHDPTGLWSERSADPAISWGERLTSDPSIVWEDR